MGKKSRKKKEKRSGTSAFIKKAAAAQDREAVPESEDMGMDNSFEEEDEVDAQTQRLMSILSAKSEDAVGVSKKHLQMYLSYLKKELELPCIVTGIEDLGCFSWEEYYNVGPGNKKEYEKLRQTQPSFRDRYMLTALDDEIEGDNGIMAHVDRISDKKKFVLILEDLEAVEKKSRNAQLLNDYTVWHVNFNW